MLIYILYGLFILSCIVLVITVLLQPGKADAGALFASSVSSTAFGPRGTQTLLAKITIGAAALFMLCALALSLPALTGARSVIQSEADTTPPAQATPAPANTNATSNTQTAAPPQQGAEQTVAPQANVNAAAPANTNATANAPATSNANSK